jgi:hypothetical protein
MWLIIKHYIILTNFCVSVRAKVSNITKNASLAQSIIR